MRSDKVLEMIEAGRLEELKKALRDEIYANSLKNVPNAKKRYSAMKKYFTYADSVREVCQRPCKIEYEGDEYTAFCNAYTLALTTESCGEMELFDDPDRYPNVTRLINYEGTEKKIDFAKVIAEAKSQGYKLRKLDFFANRCLMHYDNAYFRIALIDSTYGIIADGGEATVYHVSDPRKPLIIKNDIGLAVIMPVYRGDEEEVDDVDKIIVEVK